MLLRLVDHDVAVRPAPLGGGALGQGPAVTDMADLIGEVLGADHPRGVDVLDHLAGVLDLRASTIGVIPRPCLRRCGVLAEQLGDLVEQWDVLDRPGRVLGADQQTDLVRERTGSGLPQPVGPREQDPQEALRGVGEPGQVQLALDLRIVAKI